MTDPLAEAIAARNELHASDAWKLFDHVREGEAFLRAEAGNGTSDSYAARIVRGFLDGHESHKRLASLAEWLVAMDDPTDVLAREDRRRVTLTRIIERAREALRG